MTEWLHTVNWSIAACAFVRLVWTQLMPWIAVVRIYGHIPITLTFQLLSYAKRSVHGHVIFRFLLVVAIWNVHTVLNRNGLAVNPPHTLYLAMCVWIFTTLLSRSLPPAVLFLSNSAPQSSAIFSEISRSLKPFRTVALIKPIESHILSSASIAEAFALGCLRTGNDYEWRTVAFHLMDVAPVIVIDRSSGTSGVKEEWERIVKRRFHDRTVIIQGEDSLPEDICEIKRRLENVSDQHERQNRQYEFHRVLRSIPLRFRQNRSLLAAVIRSMWIDSHEFCRFLGMCKGLTYEAWQKMGTPLVEDIPSLMSDERVEAFLQQSRAYEEVEILLVSALEPEMARAAQFPNSNASHNVANCLTKLGKLERDRRNYDRAVHYLDDAILRFEGMPRSMDAEIEHSTALFYLGQVRMAKYRKNRDEADKILALQHFQCSIEIDERNGHDTHLARCLVSALGKESESVDRPQSSEDGGESLGIQQEFSWREPKPWQTPTGAQIIALAMAVVIGALTAFGVAYALKFPSLWWSKDSWSVVPVLHRAMFSLTVTGASLGSFVLFRVILRRDPWDK